jgi:hypothetical protein
MIIAITIALALPVTALNIFCYRYCLHLWRLRGVHARRMALLGAQLREYLDQQPCASDESPTPPRVSN